MDRDNGEVGIEIRIYMKRSEYLECLGFRISHPS